MDITILVEPVDGNGFRAVSGDPIPLEADAPTRQEALDKIRELINSRLQSGAEVVNLQVGPAPHPLARYAGALRDDPLLAPWKEAIGQYREASEQDAQDAS